MKTKPIKKTAVKKVSVKKKAPVPAPVKKTVVDKSVVPKKQAKPKSKKKAVAAKPVTPRKKINCQLPGADLLEQGKSVKEIMAGLEKELSSQHDRFCREYIIDENATRSYQRAYPQSSYETANANGTRLLVKASIKSRVNQLRDARNKRLEISADKVLRRLESRASFNIRDLYAADGSFIPIQDLDPDVAIGIKSIEIDEIFVGRGDDRTAIGITRKITCLDGKASDELLGRNLKLWKDVGSEENPLNASIEYEVVFGPED